MLIFLIIWRQVKFYLFLCLGFVHYFYWCMNTLTNVHQKQSLEVFCKKGVLRNVTKFTGKHQCQSLFFNKVAELRPATLLKSRPWHRCFPMNLAKFLRTSFLQTNLERLLLYIVEILINFSGEQNIILSFPSVPC